MDKDERIKELEEENAKLKDELDATKVHLKKYTAPVSRKEYYEQNKEAIKEYNKNYKKSTNYKYEPTPEKKKEYARRAYLNSKKKKKQELELKDNTNDENI